MQVSASGQVSAMDYSGVNHVHPVGGIAIALSSICALVVRRPVVPAVLLCVACFIPASQRIVIAGADFNFVRWMVLMCLARHAARGEFAWIRWNAIDTAMAIGVIAKIICSPMLRGEPSDLIAAIGINFETLGAYFVVRATVRSLDDVRLIVRVAAMCCVLVAPFFLVESFTGRNLFFVFGGIAEFTVMREGKIRCQGPFAHAILAGCHFVAWFPLWIAFLIGGPAKDRLLGFLGIAAGFIIVFCCASSTPLVALMMGFAVWLAFPLRAHLRLLWVAGLVLLVMLHFTMQAPVWHLISRIDLVGGSTGYHRYMLIDAAIRNFSEWWLFGILSTGHWGYFLFDVTNQFILEGIRGGVWAMLALCAALVMGFASVGSDLRRLAVARVRALRMGRIGNLLEIRRDECLVYAIGASLGAHAAIFLAVSYFGQTLLIWLFLIGFAGAHRQWSRALPSAFENAAVVGSTGAALAGIQTASNPSSRPSRDGRREAEPLPVLHREDA